ncbi:hypothetical protein [Haloplasma contractile]|uniref:Uncharacterized protein n=1 Tax=Haloplasma contractile SSD-17B TaxID=1033810 RepID=U2FKJ5_9MOLU|nr:hypothetical protein [Haloplasma contractile]ERJ13325.1 hypothetical protein HLPCO_000954 [Haloplasma contractile SSD-17B]
MSKKSIVITVSALIILALTTFNIFFNNYDQANYSIGGYDVYRKPQGKCKAYFTVVIYEDEDYEYYVSYSGCNEDDYLYIKKGLTYVSVKDAIEDDMIDEEEVIPKLRKREK